MGELRLKHSEDFSAKVLKMNQQNIEDKRQNFVNLVAEILVRSVIKSIENEEESDSISEI